jgi:hypothetical protein
MTNTLETTVPTYISTIEVDYLLKELEIQTNIEERARDRTEHMMNYLLTTIAAIIGAVLLVSEIKTNGWLVVFIGALLLYIFSITAFYRLCRLRWIISQTKLSCHLIRNRLKVLGAEVPPLLIRTEGETTGFYPRMFRNLVFLIIVCGFFGVLTFILGYALLKDTFRILRNSTANASLNYVLVGIVGFTITAIPLWIILKDYRKWAEELFDEGQDEKKEQVQETQNSD